MSNDMLWSYNCCCFNNKSDLFPFPFLCWAVSKKSRCKFCPDLKGLAELQHLLLTRNYHIPMKWFSFNFQCDAKWFWQDIENCFRILIFFLLKSRISHHEHSFPSLQPLAAYRTDAKQTNKNGNLSVTCLNWMIGLKILQLLRKMKTSLILDLPPWILH